MSRPIGLAIVVALLALLVITGLPAARAADITGGDGAQVLTNHVLSLGSKPGTIPKPQADLKISKTGTASAAGDKITFKLSISNNGPTAATNVVVSDPLPTGVSLVSTSGATCKLVGYVACSIGNLASGATVNISIVVKVNLKGKALMFCNTAAVVSSTPDPNLLNNFGTAVVKVTKK